MTIKMDKGLPDILLTQVPKDYGADYNVHCLEIYRIFVRGADAISARRQAANAFFLSINTVLLGAIGYLDESETGLKIAASVAGIAFSCFWLGLLLSYRRLNTVKFQIILEIEKILPLSPYGAEWELLERGENKKTYKPFTNTEKWVPWVFIALHALPVISALITGILSTTA